MELPSQESDRAPPASKSDNNTESEIKNENKGDKMGQDQPLPNKEVEAAPKPRTSLQE